MNSKVLWAKHCLNNGLTWRGETTTFWQRTICQHSAYKGSWWWSPSDVLRHQQEPHPPDKWEREKSKHTKHTAILEKWKNGKQNINKKHTCTHRGSHLQNCDTRWQTQDSNFPVIVVFVFGCIFYHCTYENMHLDMYYNEIKCVHEKGEGCVEKDRNRFDRDRWASDERVSQSMKWFHVIKHRIPFDFTCLYLTNSIFVLIYYNIVWRQEQPR